MRDATIALLLLHPELAEHLPPAHATTDDGTLQQLATLGLAAAYLQRQWRSRLTLALGPKPVLSINYWRAWELPDPDGPPPEYGLCRLAAHERQRRG